MSLQIVILAAGQGKRMHSDLPKVLHKVAGKPMLERVVEIAQQLNPDAIHVIIGHGGEQVQSELSFLKVNWVKQEEQLGTGHALMQAMPFIPTSSEVLVLSADVPLIQLSTLEQLIQSTKNAETPLALLLAILDNPFGLGRIVRDNTGKILSIVEEKDANPAQKAIKEIYSGICCARAQDLERWLPMLKNKNAQGEYYLTDIIRLAVAEDLSIASIHAKTAIEIQGVNDRLQLQKLERAWQKEHAEKLLYEGTSIADADRIDIRGELICGKDVFIDVNTIFSGKVFLGNRCKIGPNCVLKNVTLADDCVVHANSILEDCQVGESSHVGPFARLRPGTVLEADCKIGNFVETKETTLGQGSKANHLSYLGNARIGKNVNVGAGTITCNYDGANKHQTTIEDGAFIGSGSELVAPLTIGMNATIGAGSTVRKNAPAGELTLTAQKQKSIPAWKRPKKDHHQ